MITDNLRPFFCLLITVFFSNAAAASEQGAGAEKYVGSDQCGECHAEQYQLWQTSHHAKAMLEANAESVLGNFDNQTFTHKEVRYQFSQNESGFFIGVKENGESTNLKVSYTFGVFPLQQYLVATEDGKLQAFDVAWDSHPKEEGGQRWFKLFPELDTGITSQLHWSKHSYNWNNRCADCHSTDYKKNFDPETGIYHPSFEEVNVGCEACHGKGSKHVHAMKLGKHSIPNSGFAMSLESTRVFQFTADKSIAVGQGVQSSAQINACGGCHSRRQIVGEVDPALDYHDQYRLDLLYESMYFADGQIQDEVFVLGSFLQSKMHQAGVTCSNCHNPHSGEVKAEGNALCLQCHKAESYAQKSHHAHEPNSSGSQCINCHMPTTTYMEVDPRRDHSFPIPNLNHSAQFVTPNACTNCHTEAELNKPHLLNPKVDDFVRINAKARGGDALVLPDLLEYVANNDNPAIRRATLLDLSIFSNSQRVLTLVTQSLQSDDALVRRAAVSATRNMPPQQRWQLLKLFMADPVTSVRNEVAKQLAPLALQLRGKDGQNLSVLLKEYEAQLSLEQDSPEGLAALAGYALNQQQPRKALNYLEQALDMEPAFLPALLNLADLHRANNRDDLAKQMLEKALQAHPESAAAKFSFALYLVRQKQMSSAISLLEQATELADASAHYHYVLSLAFESVGQLDKAINTLTRANEKWPNRLIILTGLANYLGKAQRYEERREIEKVISQINRL